MELITSRFGKIEYTPNNVIVFFEGIPGFTQFKKYIIIDPKKHRPFMWLQSIENGDLALVVTNPYLFVNDYFVNVPKEELRALSVSVIEDLRMLVIVVIPKDNPQNISINLQCPILLNIRIMIGKQIILYDSSSPIKHFIFPKITKIGTRVASAG